MTLDGFANYKQFFTSPPEIVFEWHDSETEAVGWLVINSLKNGAAGGGTRMRKAATKEECIFLAKTMEVKFGISGPSIGGAKSVINFDHKNPRKSAVLERWYQAISPFLRHCYGTGGDFNVDEIKEVMPILGEFLGIKHPQEGVVRGHVKSNESQYWKILRQLNGGVGMPLDISGVIPGRFRVADMITGYGLCRALHHFYESQGDSIVGKRVLIEGFGAVGGSAAYYLAESGAKVVGVISLDADTGQFRWLTAENGLDVGELLAKRDRNNLLPIESTTGSNPSEFWEMQADVFVPAASSHTINDVIVDALMYSGVRVICCGSNNPFFVDWSREYSGMEELIEHALETQKFADQTFSIIPDFIANSGMARVFAYLMNDEATIEDQAIFKDVDSIIGGAVRELVANQSEHTGLLARAYSQFIR
jgi:glutamate dehydrogenase/leucine dehydrogenase